MRQSDFQSLALRLRPAIIRTAVSITHDADLAEDIAQDTLLRLWQLRDRLDAYRSVDALAKVIARNLALDALRARGVTVSISDTMLDLPDAAHLTPEAELISAEFVSEVDCIMARLAPAQQAVLRMRHAEAMEIEEIARVIGSTPVNVRVLLCRARARVKSLFIDSR